MSDNLILEHLRSIRDDIATLKDIVQDTGRRLTQVAIEVSQLRTSMQINHASTMLRLDSFEQRLACIEHWLVMNKDEFAGWGETVHLLKSPKNTERLLDSIRQAQLDKD